MSKINAKSEIVVTEFKSYLTSVKTVLDALGADSRLKKHKRIVIKPNLTDALFPPVTTDVNCIKAIIEYIQECNSKAKIIVAEGSGGCDTPKAFDKLGYNALEEIYGIELVDLNLDDRKTLKNKNAKVLKELDVPKTLLGAYLISVPVPKEHSTMRFTGAMKNMMGIYLPRPTFDENLKNLLARGARKILPRFTPSIWSKSRLHLLGLSEGIFDLNLYVPIDLCVMDAKIGQKECEIYGEPCKPELNKIYAGYDPVAIDSYSAKLLNVNWEKVKYLKYSDEVLGNADLKKIKLTKV